MGGIGGVCMEDQKPGGYDEWKKIKWAVIVKKKMVRQGAPFFFMILCLGSENSISFA